MPANNPDTSDRQIITTRVLNAPRELVWTAWTDPKHVPLWWGPRGFTNTFSKFEMKPGGIWRFVMHGPDGRNYPNQINFIEVVKPERLVYSHGGEGTEPVDFHVTVTFEDLAGKTKLTMTAIFPTKEKRAFVVKEYGAIEGAIQHLERLSEYLLSM